MKINSPRDLQPSCAFLSGIAAGYVLSWTGENTAAPAPIAQNQTTG